MNTEIGGAQGTAEYFAALMQKEAEAYAREEAMQNSNTPEPKEIVYLPVDILENYPQKYHPFRPATPDRLEELKRSLLENGILNPLIIWCRVDGRYQILAGHNRRTAAKLLGWQRVPCTVLYDLEENEAEAIMLEDNLQQREELLPSERAKAYQMQMDVRRRQGRRTDLTSGQLVQKWSREEISNTDSGRQVQRYIRLNYLIPELLEKVDSNALGIANAEQISFISKLGQQVIYTYFFVDKPRGKLDKKLIQELRQLDANPDKGIDHAAIDAIFIAREESRSFRQVKIPMKPIRHFFPPDITEQEVVERLLDLAEKYFTGGHK